MLKLHVIIVLIASSVKAGVRDQITVETGTFGRADLSGSDLTTSFCEAKLKECPGEDMQRTYFGATAKQCLSKCNYDLKCLGIFWDSSKYCHMRTTRCQGAELKDSTGSAYYRLKKGETCPGGQSLFVVPKIYSATFCLLKDKVCPGHDLYPKPQNVYPLTKCAEKCNKIYSCSMADFKDNKCSLKDYSCKDSELVDSPGAVNALRLPLDVTDCPGNRKFECPENAHAVGLDCVCNDGYRESSDNTCVEDKPACVDVDSPKAIDRDDDISEVTCSEGFYVTKCECVLASGGICDGVTVSSDAKTCRAHGAQNGVSVKARACCGKLLGQLEVVSSPPEMANDQLSKGSKADKYGQDAVATCPNKSQLLTCLLHTYWGPDYRNQVAQINGSKCYAPSGCSKCGVQAICHSESSSCTTVLAPNAIDHDDAISEATCPGDLYVTKCECVQLTSGGFCDGVTVSSDAKTCRAHGARNGYYVKARACCGELPGNVDVVSDPPEMANDQLSKNGKTGKYGPDKAATCPNGSKLVTCLLHTYWGPDYRNQVSQVDGNKCVAPSTCSKCGIQAICHSESSTCTNVLATNAIDRDDDISEATCPGDLYVTECECVQLTSGGYCDGVTVSSDAKTCRAHGAKNGYYVKARACCGKLPGQVEVISDPLEMANDQLSKGSRADKYGPDKAATCPNGSKLVTCVLHTYWGPDYRDQVGQVDGNKCYAPSTCSKCGVQAICFSESPSCTRVDSLIAIDQDDQISEATCSGDTYVTKCECVSLTSGGYCDGVTVTSDAKTCRAHGARNGVSVKARACCDKLPGLVEVVSDPLEIANEQLSDGSKADHYGKDAAATCPSGSTLVTCLLHTYWGPDYQNQVGHVNGNKCFASSSCSKCGVQAICHSESASCTNVLAPNAIERDDDISEATCPGDLYVTKCECVSLTSGGYCDGVTVTSDAKTCRAHGAKNGYYVKARACCGQFQGKVEVVSDPPEMANDQLSMNSKAGKYGKDAAATCPDGSKLLTCLLHSYWGPEYRNEVSLVDGNKCYASSSCAKCGVQAICQSTSK